MKKTLLVSVVMAVGVCLFGQELTHEQVAAARLQQATSVQTQSIGADRALDDSAQELELLLLEASTKDQGPKKIRVAKPSSGFVATALIGGGDNEDDPIFLGSDTCGTNQYIPYNVPPLTDSSWHTYNSPNTQLPWHFYTSTPVSGNGNGPAVESYPNFQLPNTQWRSTFYRGMPNDYDQYGDPMAHTIAFWYQFFRTGSGDHKFWCNISFISDSIGIAMTNLPSTSGAWRRASLYIRPYAGILPQVNFITMKADTVLYTGPSAIVDPAIAWCVIPTPLTNLRINDQVTNVVVKWNIPSYNTNRWDLQYAAVVDGPYVTYTNSSPVITNGLASLVFVKSDGRFYRLKHK